MKDHNVLLAFTGQFDIKIINALIRSVKSKLKEVEKTTKIQKRVYNIMVECLETLFKNYGASKASAGLLNTFALFTLGKADDHYYLISGNYVESRGVPLLKEKIDRINEMSVQSKKDLYRKIITDHDLEVYNADLAIIDIAIKSNCHLQYDFKEVNDTTSFYLFEVKIKTDY